MIQDFYILSFARKTPKHLVIVLHGYGANSKDLISMAQYWKNILKDTLFVVPNAPTPVPHSVDGYQWFDIGDLSLPYLRQGSQDAASILRDFVINIQTAYKIPREKTTLSGFSQGGMLALATGLLYEPLCKGILSYSGGLFLSSEHLSSASSHVEVCLIHGTDDSVVPHAASKETYEYLLQRNNNVTFHSIPHLAHQINEAGLLQGAHFLQSMTS